MCICKKILRNDKYFLSMVDNHVQFLHLFTVLLKHDLELYTICNHLFPFSYMDLPLTNLSLCFFFLILRLMATRPCFGTKVHNYSDFLFHWTIKPLQNEAILKTCANLTPIAPITTAADDIHKYFFIVFQRK